MQAYVQREQNLLHNQKKEIRQMIAGVDALSEDKGMVTEVGNAGIANAAMLGFRRLEFHASRANSFEVEGAKL